MSPGAQQKETPEAQSSVLLPDVLDMKPLRSVPYLMTRSQQQKNRSSVR